MSWPRPTSSTPATWAVGIMTDWAKLGVIIRDEADGVTRAFEAEG